MLMWALFAVGYFFKDGREAAAVLWMMAMCSDALVGAVALLWTAYIAAWHSLKAVAWTNHEIGVTVATALTAFFVIVYAFYNIK